MLELGIVSDEIAPDFEEAIHHGLKWGIKRYEIRMLKSERIPQVDESEIEKICQLIHTHQLKITAVSPGIFKHPVSEEAALEHELNSLLPKTIDFARRVGSKLIVAFGFKQNESDRNGQCNKAVEIVRQAAEKVTEAGMTLALENEPGFLCNTGRNTARFIEQVDHPAVKSNWDPCNSLGTDEQPYPEGYQAIKKHIVNVHAKDTKRGALVECLPLGEGYIDWPGQVKALLEDDIVPHITIETHCLPLIKQSKKNVRYLKKLFNTL